MADGDLRALADTVLTTAAEHEWALLRELVDFADRLVVAFVFADRFPVRVLRARLQREARKSGMPFRLVVCDEPEALRNDALAAVLAPEADHEITWFEAFGAEEALRQAWLFAAQRWNEHREPLRRSSLRALIVAAPLWAKPVIRLAAPDLWSITNLVVEPAALPAPLLPQAPERVEQYLGTPAERAAAESSVAYALALAGDVQRNQALIEALAAAAHAGAWQAAELAAEQLDLGPEALTQLVGLAKRGKKRKVDPSLAASLNNLSGHLAALGRLDDALSVSQVASDLYRTLAESEPTVFRPQQAKSLTNLANRFDEVGRASEAIAATHEAIAISRDLASSRPDEAGPILAAGLNNLSIRLGQLGRLTEALAAAQEATRLFRALPDVSRSNFLPGLAKSLINQGSLLMRLGFAEEALCSILEALAMGREVVATDPPFLPILASMLHNLGNAFGQLGRFEEALAATEESVAIRVGLSRSRPEIFLPHLLIGRRDLLARLELAKRDPESSAALRDAEALLESAGLATASERQ